MRRLFLLALLAFLSAVSITRATVLTARENASAVWTGTEMIVWGGDDPDSGTYFGDGFRYDPNTNAWAEISMVGAPSPRTLHTAIWTGTEMIVWGGYDGDGLEDGARYDPATDTWTPVSHGRAPHARANHTAVWTGTEMIVWGGSSGRLDHKASFLETGGRYDPAIDRWTPTSVLDTPGQRSLHTAIWTGTEMIVFAGRTLGEGQGQNMPRGGRYDPSTDIWSALSEVNVPERRYDHTAVWTGTEMIVWAGSSRGEDSRLGGIYDPATDMWTEIAPSPHSARGHEAFWTGVDMVTWGGRKAPRGSSGYRYDPASDTWSSLEGRGELPEGTLGYSAVWTGDRLIVWGGLARGLVVTNTGSVYDPVTRHWTATPTETAP